MLMRQKSDPLLFSAASTINLSYHLLFNYNSVSALSVIAHAACVLTVLYNFENCFKFNMTLQLLYTDRFT